MKEPRLVQLLVRSIIDFATGLKHVFLGRKVIPIPSIFLQHYESRKC
jgi:hypothetical protein